MAIFEVKLKGTLYRKWEPNQEISLADCKFTDFVFTDCISKNCGLARRENNREFIISTEVEANNEQEAEQLGIKRCSDATFIFEFCINEQVDLKPEQICLKERGKEAKLKRTSETTIEVVGNEALNDEQLDALKKALNAINGENDAVKDESLIRAISWQGYGKREKKNKIDRFIKFWIALEILVEGSGKGVVRKIIESLEPLYPNVFGDEKNREIVGRIYGIRTDIVHFGVQQPQDLDMILQQLENILADLLGHRLGLTFKASAKQHFV